MEKKLEATAPSSAPLESAIRGSLPSQYVAQAFTLFGELQGYRDGPAKARQARTEHLEAAIARFYLDHQAHFEGFPLRERTTAVRDKLGFHLGRYDLADVPSRAVVKRVVYRLAEK